MSEDFINLEKKPKRKKDIFLSILVLIVVFLIVFSFVTIREYGVRELFSSASQTLLEEIEERFFDREENMVGEDPEIEEEEEVEIASYKEVAQSGDGLTHLARRAISSYIEDNDIEISKEERIYMEDYVQKRLAPEKTGLRFLDIGEEVEISVELIEEALEEANQLTPSQIDNLTQYTNIVSF